MYQACAPYPEETYSVRACEPVLEALAVVWRPVHGSLRECIAVTERVIIYGLMDDLG